LHNVWCAIDLQCRGAAGQCHRPDREQYRLRHRAGADERISIKDGAVEQSNFYDYIASRNRDVPPMHVEVIQTDNHPTGVGQMATPAITPAVSNAVMAMTGVRLRHAPFTEERVKKALA
jgi:isoquinoline 1-oxidoreductase beta subunit